MQKPWVSDFTEILKTHRCGNSACKSKSSRSCQEYKIGRCIVQETGQCSCSPEHLIRLGDSKDSLRTDPKQLNASAVCALLGGGGHAAASGATVEGDIQQTKEVLMAAIRQVQGRQV